MAGMGGKQTQGLLLGYVLFGTRNTAFALASIRAMRHD
jgi:hypothetical protein